MTPVFTALFAGIALLFLLLWWRTPDHVKALRVLYLLGAGPAAVVTVMWIVSAIYLFPAIDAAMQAGR